jgi:hypothetical protein
MGMVMSMGWDYVSELQSPTGLLFEHGKPWWNDADRGKLLIRPPEFSGNPISRVICSKQEERANGMMNLTLRSIFIRTCKWLFTCPKILRHGASGFTSPPKEGVLRIFIALKNQSPLPGSILRTLGPVASTLITTPPWRQANLNI